ncbi:unnamed protein product [Mytilus coruscus]|uniref:Uncharacterized protein n=1 Tax=Mytilus coruscus TaxID=42192 RepID=A0A6J8AL98_MYTCO|nr:unnamed protein product [Mytilus coruscus]
MCMLLNSYWESRICLQFVLQCEDIRGHTDEQSSTTSWNVITHVAPRCSLRILGLEPEPVLIPVAYPELPRKNQPEYLTTVCEDTRGHIDEQESPTSWNVITHVAPRCSLRILGLEPEPVLIPVAYPEMPSNSQTEHCKTVVHRARLFSFMVPKPVYQIDDEVIIDEDEIVENGTFLSTVESYVQSLTLDKGISIFPGVNGPGSVLVVKDFSLEKPKLQILISTHLKKIFLEQYPDCLHLRASRKLFEKCDLVNSIVPTPDMNCRSEQEQDHDNYQIPEGYHHLQEHHPDHDHRYCLNLSHLRESFNKYPTVLTQTIMFWVLEPFQVLDCVSVLHAERLFQKKQDGQRVHSSPEFQDLS